MAIEFRERKRRWRSVLLFWVVVRGGSAPARGEAAGAGTGGVCSCRAGRAEEHGTQGRSALLLFGRRRSCSSVLGGWRLSRLLVGFIWAQGLGHRGRRRAEEADWNGGSTRGFL
jgi:hypothetical protein